MEQVIVREVDMPEGVKGFVRLDPEGDYNIYINAKYNMETKLETFRHEMRHIENRDFQTDVPIEEVEGAGRAL